MLSYDEKHFWEACVMAAIASGRVHQKNVAELADAMVEERSKRFPPEARRDDYPEFQGPKA